MSSPESVPEINIRILRSRTYSVEERDRTRSRQTRFVLGTGRAIDCTPRRNSISNSNSIINNDNIELIPTSPTETVIGEHQTVDLTASDHSNQSIEQIEQTEISAGIAHQNQLGEIIIQTDSSVETVSTNQLEVTTNRNQQSIEHLSPNQSTHSGNQSNQSNDSNSRLRSDQESSISVNSAAGDISQNSQQSTENNDQNADGSPIRSNTSTPISETQPEVITTPANLRIISDITSRSVVRLDRRIDGLNFDRSEPELSLDSTSSPARLNINLGNLNRRNFEFLSRAVLPRLNPLYKRLDFTTPQPNRNRQPNQEENMANGDGTDQPSSSQQTDDRDYTTDNGQRRANGGQNRPPPPPPPPQNQQNRQREYMSGTRNNGTTGTASGGENHQPSDGARNTQNNGSSGATSNGSQRQEAPGAPSANQLQDMIADLARTINTLCLNGHQDRQRDNERFSRLEDLLNRQNNQPVVQMPAQQPAARQAEVLPIQNQHFDQQHAAIKIIQRRLDTIRLDNFPIQEGIKQIIRVGDLIHADLETDYEDFYFIQEIKFKFVAFPQINPDRIMGINDWNELKQTVNELTGQENSWSAVEYRLDNLRQINGESMLAYTQKTTALYTDYLALYGVAPSHAVKQKTSRDIARQFIKGVASKAVKRALTSHGLTHELSIILKTALEQEVLQQMDEPDMELICMFCTNRGHRRRDCAIREKAIRDSNALSNDPNAQCHKCGSIGHTAYICKVVPKSEQQKQQSGQSNQNNNNQNQTSNRNNSRSDGGNSENRSGRRDRNRNRNGDRDDRDDRSNRSNRDDRNDNSGRSDNRDNRNRDRDDRDNRSNKSNRDDRKDNRGRGNRQNRGEREHEDRDQREAYIPLLDPRLAVPNQMVYAQYPQGTQHQSRFGNMNRAGSLPNLGTYLPPPAQRAAQQPLMSFPAAQQQNSAPQANRSTRAVQPEDDFEPDFHSTEQFNLFSEN